MTRLARLGIAVAACAFACAPGIAAEKPYVAFVNVGGAVDPALLADAVQKHLPGVMPVRAKLINAKSVDVAKIANPKSREEWQGAEMTLRVYFVDTGDLPPQLTAPGMWAVINVHNLGKGANAAKFAERIRKMVLKGLAFACGFGANQDVGRCVMGAGSFDSLGGIDSTSASYSPFVAFPMMDWLSARGLLRDEPVVE